VVLTLLGWGVWKGTSGVLPVRFSRQGDAPRGIAPAARDAALAVIDSPGSQRRNSPGGTGETAHSARRRNSHADDESVIVPITTMGQMLATMIDAGRFLRKIPLTITMK
jgi:hypothetical protein